MGITLRRNLSGHYTRTQWVHCPLADHTTLTFRLCYLEDAVGVTQHCDTENEFKQAHDQQIKRMTGLRNSVIKAHLCDQDFFVGDIEITHQRDPDRKLIAIKAEIDGLPEFTRVMPVTVDDSDEQRELFEDGLMELALAYREYREALMAKQETGPQPLQPAQKLSKLLHSTFGEAIHPCPHENERNMHPETDALFKVICNSMFDDKTRIASFTRQLEVELQKAGL